jgi:hypothetical protein
VGYPTSSYQVLFGNNTSGVWRDQAMAVVVVIRDLN